MQNDYLGDAAGVAQLQPSKKPIILLGELVFASLEKSPIRKGFLPQPPRSLGKILRIGKQRHMYVQIHETLLNVEKRVRFSLAVDSILRYGRKQKGRCIIINGSHSVDETYISLYTFDKGELVKISEKILVSADNFRYDTEVRQLLDQHSHPDTRLIWTNPLLPVDYPGLILAKDTPFAKATSTRLTRHTAHHGLRQMALPAGLAIVALVGYAATVASDVARFNAVKHDYQRLAAAGPTSIESLDLLRARDQWMKSGNPLQQQLPNLDKLLIAVGSHPDWRITELTLGESDQMEGPNTEQAAKQAVKVIQFKLRVQRQPDVAPLDQAQPILAELASSTGITLRLVPQGWQEAHEGNQTWLSLTIKSGSGESPTAKL
ncbi:hypothetical protein ACFFU8_09240 [Chromobacterium piscinae]|nr:hypothetical protein [Chromobacterium piscinae]MCD5327912.1 hypothetical protein [Chromobacterium piscinae]